MRPQAVVLIAATFLYAMGMLGCASTKETGPRKNHYSRDYILAEEIREENAVNGYELVRNLRPHWLQSFGVRSMSSPVVFVDDMKRGEIDALTTIPISHIAKVQFLKNNDAFVRYGLDYPAGVISITTN